MRDRKVEGKPPAGPIGEISRREWLLKVSEAAFVFGFSGSAGELTAGMPAILTALDVQALPPGLYEPNSQHMADVLTRDDRYVKIPAGSETDYVQPRRRSFRPAFFEDHEFRVIRQLVKLILGSPPEGTAPPDKAEFEQTIADIAEWIDLVVSRAGAVREVAHQLSRQHRALAVAYYGREAVEELETAGPEKVCRDGLRSLDVKCRELHGAPFSELNTASQIEVVSLIPNASSRPDRERTAALFLSYLTSQTVRGFYTSRLGLKELGYKGNSFWVECPGCKAD